MGSEPTRLGKALAGNVARNVVEASANGEQQGMRLRPYQQEAIEQVVERGAPGPKGEAQGGRVPCGKLKGTWVPHAKLATADLAHLVVLPSRAVIERLVAGDGQLVLVAEDATLWKFDVASAEREGVIVPLSPRPGEPTTLDEFRAQQSDLPWRNPPDLMTLRTMHGGCGQMATVQNPSSIWIFDTNAKPGMSGSSGLETLARGARVLHLPPKAGVGRWFRVNRVTHLWMCASRYGTAQLEINGGIFDPILRALEEVPAKRRLTLGAGFRWDEEHAATNENIVLARSMAGIYDDDAIGWMANEAWVALRNHHATAEEALTEAGLKAVIVVSDMDWPRDRVLVTPCRMAATPEAMLEHLFRIDGVVADGGARSNHLIRRDTNRPSDMIHRLLNAFTEAPPQHLVQPLCEWDREQCLAENPAAALPVPGKTTCAFGIADPRAVKKMIAAAPTGTLTSIDHRWDTTGGDPVKDIRTAIESMAEKPRAILGQTLTTDHVHQNAPARRAPSAPILNARWRFRATGADYRVLSLGAGSEQGPTLFCESAPGVKLPMPAGYVFDHELWEELILFDPSPEDVGPAARRVRIQEGVGILRGLRREHHASPFASTFDRLVVLLENALDAPEPIELRPLSALLSVLHDARLRGRGQVTAADVLGYLLAQPATEADKDLRLAREGFFHRPLQVPPARSWTSPVQAAPIKYGTIFFTQGAIITRPDPAQRTRPDQRATHWCVVVDTLAPGALEQVTLGEFEVRGAATIKIGDDQAFEAPIGTRIKAFGAEARVPKGTAR
jgi:hypothetical protein